MATAPQLSSKQMTEYLEQLVDVETRLHLLREERKAFEAECRARNERYLPSSSSGSFMSFGEYERQFRKEEDRRISSVRKHNGEVAAESKRYRIKGTCLIVIGGCVTLFGLFVSFGFLTSSGSVPGDNLLIFLPFCAIGVWYVVAGWQRIKLSKSIAADQHLDEPASTSSAVIKRKWEKERDRFEAKQQKERTETEDYNRDVRAYNARRSEMIHEFYDAISETDDVRADLYNLYRVIHPKYRNLAAVCTIYDYFSTGRVSTLQGPDGAYNLYEAELRQNAIIDRLDSIDSKMDDLRRGQYQLYLAVNETNRQLSEFRGEVRQIGSDVQSIKASSAVTVACSSATAANTEALKYITLATA